MESWIRTGRALQSIRAAFSGEAFSAVVKALAGHRLDNAFHAVLMSAAGPELQAYTGYIENREVGKTPPFVTPVSCADHTLRDCHTSTWSTILIDVGVHTWCDGRSWRE